MSKTKKGGEAATKKATKVVSVPCCPHCGSKDLSPFGSVSYFWDTDIEDWAVDTTCMENIQCDDCGEENVDPDFVDEEVEEEVAPEELPGGSAKTKSKKSLKRFWSVHNESEDWWGDEVDGRPSWVTITVFNKDVWDAMRDEDVEPWRLADDHIESVVEIDIAEIAQRIAQGETFDIEKAFTKEKVK